MIDQKDVGSDWHGLALYYGGGDEVRCKIYQIIFRL